MSSRRLAVAGLAAVIAASIGAASQAPASSGLAPLLVEPDRGYAPIYTLLASAKHTLDMTMYELRDPQAVQTLVDDAARGVKVRVLLDKAYNGGPYNVPVFNELSAHGVDVHWASTKVAITHQKSFVVDAKKAVVMTGNLTAPYYKTSRDFAIVDTKAKDVAAIETTFALDYANTKGVAPAGVDLVWSPGSAAGLVALIASAKKTLAVENEELAAPTIVSALAAAAGRGVDVELVMTNQKNWRANFDALKKAGVHVRTYKPSATLYIHAKVIVADAHRAFVGSQNFSFRSMQQNRELGLTTTSKALVAALQHTLAQDFSGGTPW